MKKLFNFDRNVFAAGFVSLFMDISSEMIYPLLPLFLANVIGVNKSVIGLIEGIAESTASIMKGFFGWVSDRIKKRKLLMLLGYSVSTLSRPVMAVSTTWHQVLLSRFIDRFGKGVRTAPRDAIIADSTEKTHYARAFGIHRAMDTLGATIGPLIAFWLLSVFSGDYRKVFWFSMIPGVIAVLIIIFYIREKSAKANPSTTPFSKGGEGDLTGFASNPPKSPFSKGGWLHFDWKFKFFIIIVSVFAFGNSSDAFLILRAENAGIPVKTIPLVYLMFNFVYSLSSYPAGVLADKFGRKRVILSGFILFAAVYFGFAIAGSAKIIWALFLFYGLFMGLTEGIQKGFLATIIPPDFKATAFGIYNTAIGLMMLPASLIAGFLWDKVSPASAFYFGAITAAISSILFVFYIMKYGSSEKI